jgi:2-(1,2-epoxy-1,2-dihydrophenyl)acetyl-CoA isomerase
MNDSVLYEVEGGVVNLTFNRPKVLNALDSTMREGLEQAIDRLEAERGLRVVVLRGAGGGFMAGGNIKYFTELTPLSPEERRRRFEGFIHQVHPTIIRLRRLPVPVIASVHGPVAGIGMSFLMAADLAIASEDAVFTLAYIHLGTSPDGGSSFFLPRTVGMKRAMEVALLGERFDAKTAREWGLVNWVVSATDLPERTAALARRLASGPARAYASTKRLLARSIGSSLEEQLQAEAEGFSTCASSEDFVEGVNAFIAKRPARFQGT